MIIPNIWKNKIHVPNHQPDIIYVWSAGGPPKHTKTNQKTMRVSLLIFLLFDFVHVLTLATMFLLQDNL